MPFQDAAAPSRRQILAAERKKHGAYDPVRLAKLLNPKLKFQRRLLESRPHGPFTLAQSPAHLVRRSADSDSDSDGSSDSSLTGNSPTGTPPPSASNLPPAPANPGAVSTTPTSHDDDPDQPDLSTSSSVPYINYGEIKPQDHGNLAKPEAMPNDTTAVVPADPGLISANGGPSSSNHSETGGSALHNHLPHRMAGMISGLVTLVIILVALGCFFKRYRSKLSSHSNTSDSLKHKRAKSCVQRLGSVDLLRSGAGSSSKSGSAKEQLVACEDKTGSSDFLVSQVSPSKAGPFDRAIANMLSNSSISRTRTQIPSRNGTTATANVKRSEKAARPTRRSLSLTLPKAAVVHQRSLDSIAEVQEPPTSCVSSGFQGANNNKRDTVGSVQLQREAPSLDRRLTWTEHAIHQHRPMTSPGRASTFGSTMSGSPESRLSGCKLSPARPQSAKAGDIEMTKQGSKLVIRDKPCTATLRRPLSSAGSSIRSALRKTCGNSEEGGAICIETDDIIGRETDDGRGRGRELRSHFSCSTLRTQARTSCITAASTSPSGSFSFEIKDAVRRCAPIPLTSTNDLSELKVTGEETSADHWTGTSEESFVRDLDWDLRDCTLTSEVSWIPQEVDKAKPCDL